jgi:hypothetical protein
LFFCLETKEPKIQVLQDVLFAQSLPRIAYIPSVAASPIKSGKRRLYTQAYALYAMPNCLQHEEKNKTCIKNIEVSAKNKEYYAEFLERWGVLTGAWVDVNQKTLENLQRRLKRFPTSYAVSGLLCLDFLCFLRAGRSIRQDLIFCLLFDQAKSKKKSLLQQLKKASP